MMIDIPQMSLRAGIMIGMIIIVRALGLGRLPKRTFTALWSAAILRLLLPFSISVNLGALTKCSTPAKAFMDSMMAQPDLINGTSAVKGGMAETALADMPSASKILYNIIPIVWFVGLMLGVLYFSIAFVHAYRRFALSRPVHNAFIENWRRGHSTHVKIQQNSYIAAPLTYGFFRPTILLPSNMDWKDERTLDLVLTHELIHIRHLDGVKKLFLTFAVCLHWFNPMVWVMYILANRDIELACDEAVIGIMGRNLRGDYARALIKMEERHSGFISLCNNFSKNVIEERITSIMKIKKYSIASLLLAILLVTGMTSAFALTYSFDAQETSDPNEIASNMHELFQDYAKYGLSVDEENLNLIYDGKVVRYFEDMWPIYPGAEGEFVGRVHEQSDGDIDVYSVRDYSNATNEHPEGVLTGLRVASQDEFDAYTRERESMQYAYAIDGSYNAASESKVVIESEEAGGVTNPVETDIQETTHIFTDMDGNVTYVESHPLEAPVTEDGDSNGNDAIVNRYIVHSESNENSAEAVEDVVVQNQSVFYDNISEATGTTEQVHNPFSAETGKTFEQLFRTYEKIGITFIYTEGSAGNVFYNGVPVRKFTDQKPDGSVFSFESDGGGEIDISVCYDENGKMAGVTAK